MDPDDAADLLAELPKPEQEVLLDLMEPDEAAPVRQLLKYTPGTAGSVMTSEPVILTAGRHGRRGAGPDPGAAAVPGGGRPGVRDPGADGHADRPLPGRGALPAAAARAAGRPARRGGRQRHRPAAPGPPRCRRSPAGWPRTTWSRCRWSTGNDRLVGAVTVDDVLDHSLPRDWRDRDAANARTPGNHADARGRGRRCTVAEQRRPPARPAARAPPDQAAPVRPGGVRPLVGGHRPVHGHARSSSST